MDLKQQLFANFIVSKTKSVWATYHDPTKYFKTWKCQSLKKKKKARLVNIKALAVK